MAATAATGVALLADRHATKGLTFTAEERARHGLVGLLPAATWDMDRAVETLHRTLSRMPDDLSKYEMLMAVAASDTALFYSALRTHLAALMPVVYTPTVGRACTEYSHITIPRTMGLYITLADRGRVAEALARWPQRPVRAIVVTDGERILGLGDLGANGMGIPVGKLALYCALAGVDPATTLPITLDVGTNNAAALADPAYIGSRKPRESGADYYALVDEFVTAAQATFGARVLIQWEDFGNHSAFDVLHKYQNTAVSFNDDIQGTASVVLAGLLSCPRITGKSLAEGTFLFYGAGEAGVGIADLLAYALSIDTGSTVEEQRRKIWLVDSKGIVTSTGRDLARLEKHKLAYAHPLPGGVTSIGSDLISIINAVKPTALVGVSAQGGAFTKAVVSAMCELNEQPIIFALSNPTSKSECTAEQAYSWSHGRAIFASGSPFDACTVDIPAEAVSPRVGSLSPLAHAMRSRSAPGGHGFSVSTAGGATASPSAGSSDSPLTPSSVGTVSGHFVPGQANNSWIFPAVGLAVIAVQMTRVTDHTMYVAAKSLAAQVTESDLETGCLFPKLETILDVSARIAAAIAADAYSRGEAALAPQPADLLAYMRASQWHPTPPRAPAAATSGGAGGAGATAAAPLSVDVTHAARL